MPRRTIVKVYPSYDDKPTFIESPVQRVSSPDRTSAGKTLNSIERFDEPLDTDPWLSGGAHKYPVPKNGDPWETCIEKIRSYDGEMCDGWREEVDNLLIFAGLFSAAVTAFVIESYQQLSEDPTETNNWLLQQILVELHNANTGNTAATNAPLPTRPVFTPSGTDIRVNVFWFMSLALSLATVVVGILCTQWIREYERDPPLDPKEALTLRQIRHEGLLTWKVPEILSVLPVLLHSSLVLFFAGLLDLLWSLNHTVAIFVTLISGVVFFFIVATTVLPTLQMLFVKDMRLRTSQCAYKSAQSWLVHRIVTFIVKLFARQSVGLGKVPFSYFSRYRPFFNNKDWVDFDLRWREAREKPQFSSTMGASPKKSSADSANSDMVRSLVWIDKNLGQNIEMINAMYHCIRDLPLDQSIQTVVQLDESIKSHLISSHDQSIHYPTRSTSPDERRDMLSALFLELNSRAFPQLDQHQLESVVRNLNSRLDFLTRHPKQATHIEISKCLPFVHWPLHSTRDVPGDLVTQFLICLKALVAQEQTNAEIDKHIWALIQQILSNPVIEEVDSQHDLHAQLAFEIMLAYENQLSTSKGSEDEKERETFRQRVRACAQHIMKAFPPGELRGLSAEPRKHAKKVILDIQTRMEGIGGVEQILVTPDDRNKWAKIAKIAQGLDTPTAPSDYRTDTWDNPMSMS
ncbi:hypothetical protein BDN70DRAFT_440589 [Pholiota conissans]|uniref:DUF6535 domain-containing protein n=1 Tax=Pholiota conissans TaxID=109636 RepID=A0A9P5YRR7_9AGAR|nr:hypothetical protein BDN70DRAFT_440589 [Pholiota conissans]